MKKPLPILLFALCCAVSVRAQDFEYGAVTIDDLNMKQYPADTSAGAVVLKEFGEAFISNGDDYNLVFRYHVRIKILKKSGLGQSDVEIDMDSDGGNRFEKITEIKASSYNLENGSIREETLAGKDFLTESSHKYLRTKKFAIPNVRVGSVIEYAYTLESPFIYNFRRWEFQSSIPKIRSEYWARIPGVYRYNVTLRGFLKLSTNENSIVKSCLGTARDPLSGGFSADCLLLKLAMTRIPAFVEEDYMTAKKNFLAAVNFELSEIHYPDGRVDKVTKEWKDVEVELRNESRFGVQLRRGKDIGAEVEKLVAGESDELGKAKKVYNFIRDWYVWNGVYGKYSENGIKKAFEDRKGNIGDINLSLVAALRFAGLDVEPLILSTRGNGSVVELHPVLSEFNYVVAKVNIGGKSYLADASQKYYPFGLLPERCLNGKGRVIGDRNSYWFDLAPSDVGKTVSVFTLVLDSAGLMKGSLQSTFMGYDAADKREEILSFASEEEYVRALNKSLEGVRVTSCELKNLNDPDKPVSRKLDIELTAFGEETSNFLFNPFFYDKWSENPFKSTERLYPVDFGAPIERVIVLNLEYPSSFEVVNIPERVGLSLPGSGGKFLFEVANEGNKLSLHNTFSIRKTVFTSAEYHYLKELFSRILQVQSGELYFKKKV